MSATTGATIDALRDAAHGANVPITSVVETAGGLRVAYGSWDDAGEAERLASPFLEDDEATCRWETFGPRGFRGLWVQMYGRETGLYGHVVPTTDVPGMISGLEAEWRHLYAYEQSRRGKVMGFVWPAVAVALLLVALFFAWTGLLAVQAGAVHSPVVWFAAALIVGIAAPTWDSGETPVPPAAVDEWVLKA